MILKNPKECFCLQQRQTFFVLNELTAPECKDGSEPLTLHHSTFSRFKFVIINADKKATTSNIPASAIPEILETVKMKIFQDLCQCRRQLKRYLMQKIYPIILHTQRLSARGR